MIRSHKLSLATARLHIKLIQYPPLQWRSQDIIVARAQHGCILRLYKLQHKVQKLIGGFGGILLPENLGILQPPRSVLRPYTVAKYKSLTVNSHNMSI